MLAACIAVLLSQHLPCDQQGQRRETPEPPAFASEVIPPPIVQPGGFVPYHLIPVARFPIAEAVIERARGLIQNRPKLRGR